MTRRVAFCLLVLGLTLSCCRHVVRSATDVATAARRDPVSGFRLVDICPGSGEVTVVGRVEDGCRRPVGGVAVFVLDPQNPVCFYHCTTDTAGAFAIPRLPATASYEVLAEVKQDGCAVNTSTTVAGTGGAIVYVPIALPPSCCDRRRE